MLIRKVIADRVCIINQRQLVGETETGLKLADVGSDVIYRGQVVSAGPDCTQVSEGECVVFEKKTGIEIRYKDVVYRIIREKDLMFILDPEEVERFHLTTPHTA